MSAIWNGFLSFIETVLTALHNVIEPLFGVHSWGWAIILLTISVRVLLLPLAVKQTRSMKAMQTIAPEVKKIQKKYPTDRDMMRSDPEKYRARKAKQNEETMALYKEAGVNPVGGCLPLVMQMPIFFALFSVLRNFDLLKNAQFYFFTSGIDASVPIPEGLTEVPLGLGAVTTAAGLPGYMLIAAMGLTMFVSQKQMMARSAGPADSQQAQTQKIMLYVMPVMLTFFGINLPLGVLLYWVTTNLWQMGQQAYIMRDTGDAAVAGGTSPGDNGRKGAAPAPKKPSGSSGTSTKKPSGKQDSTRPKNSRANGPSGKGSSGKGSTSKTSSTAGREHLPKRKRG